MRYQDCIFDLYGTLVDIHTDERQPQLWEKLAGWYRENGAAYAPEELQDAYFQTVREMEGGKASLRNDAHEAHPEIQIEYVFQSLYRQKGIEAGLDLSIRTGERFRKYSLDYIRLYSGAEELLKALRANGQRVWLLSNAQHIFDGIYLSSDYGCKKPDWRFFDVLLKEREIQPENAIMIGNDGVCDIQGARAVGLSTLYIRSNISPKEPLPEADYVLEEMDLDRVRAILSCG